MLLALFYLSSLTMRKGLFIGLFISIFVLACEQPVFDKFENLNKNEWQIEDTISFQFKIGEPDDYSVLLQLRHTKEYSFSNIWTKIIHDFPGDKKDTAYLFQTVVADPISGKWLGECTSNYCTVSASVLENISFSDTGIYKISMVQYMRTNPLEDVSDVGLKVEKSSKD